MEFDLNNRDPHDMNNYIQVEFDDVLAEPAGTYSADCVWKNSYKCFTCGKNLCYKILTFFFGIFAALLWGCFFACVSFTVIWGFAPSIRALHILLNPFKKIYNIILAACFGPYFETIGLLFSRIHVTMSQGPPPKPIDHIDGNHKELKYKF